MLVIGATPRLGPKIGRGMKRRNEEDQKGGLFCVAYLSVAAGQEDFSV